MLALEQPPTNSTAAATPAAAQILALRLVARISCPDFSGDPATDTQ
jgi:hypothetical protein